MICEASGHGSAGIPTSSENTARKKTLDKSLNDCLDAFQQLSDKLHRVETSIEANKGRTEEHEAILRDPNLPFRPEGKGMQAASLKSSQDLSERRIRLEEEREATLKSMRATIDTWRGLIKDDPKYESDPARVFNIPPEDWDRWQKELGDAPNDV